MIVKWKNIILIHQLSILLSFCWWRRKKPLVKKETFCIRKFWTKNWLMSSLKAFLRGFVRIFKLSLFDFMITMVGLKSITQLFLLELLGKKMNDLQWVYLLSRSSLWRKMCWLQSWTLAKLIFVVPMVRISTVVSVAGRFGNGNSQWKKSVNLSAMLRSSFVLSSWLYNLLRGNLYIPTSVSISMFNSQAYSSGSFFVISEKNQFIIMLVAFSVLIQRDVK